MTIGEFLPELRATHPAPTHPHWDLDADFFDPFEAAIGQFFIDLLLHLETPAATEVITESLKRIIEYKKKYLDQAELVERIEFIQLNLCAGLLNRLNATGNFHFAFDMVTLCIIDRVLTVGEQYELNIHPRLFGLLGSQQQHIQSSIRWSLYTWFNGFFFYSRNFSGLNDWGIHVISEFIVFCQRCPDISVQEAQCLSNAISWLSENKLNREKAIVQKQLVRRFLLSLALEAPEITHEYASAILLVPEIPIGIKKSILSQGRYLPRINPSLDVQIDIARVRDFGDSDETLDSLDNRLNYLHNLLAQDFEGIERRKIMSSKAGILEPYLVDRSIAGKHGHIVRALGSYMQLGEDFDSNFGLLIPNLTIGCVLLTPQQQLVNRRDGEKTAELIVNMVNLENRTLSRSNLLRGTASGPPTHTTERIGVPKPKHSNGYFKAIQEVYGAEKFKDLKEGEITSILPLGFLQTPIQAIMIESFGKTYPIQTSLSIKKGFSASKRILFIECGSSTSELEHLALVSVFKGSDTQLDHILAGEISKTDILEKIKEPYDIIWFSGHGQHEHYAPELSNIPLSNDEFISLEELFVLGQSSRGKRQLFFLNICEGGIVTQTGPILNLGIPNALANSEIDVIGHLWMVNPIVALVHGVLFAHHLGAGKTWFESYQATMIDMLTGKERIVELLTELKAQDVLDRANNSSLDWSNLLHWGSSAYWV